MPSPATQHPHPATAIAADPAAVAPARDRTKLAARVTAAVVALSAMGLALATAVRPLALLGRGPVTEDAFYALAVSRNIALGHGITIDGVLSTNGFQPLRTFVDVPLFLLAGGDRVGGLRLTLLGSSLLWLACAAVLALTARDRARRAGLGGDLAAALAVVVTLGSVSAFRIFHNGLETGLELLLLACAVFALDRVTAPRGRALLGLGVLLGALAWARLDATLFAVAYAVVAYAPVLHRGRRSWPRGPLVACLIAAVLLTPWLARNVALDGHIVPTSAVAESGVHDSAANAQVALQALGAWAVPPLGRPDLHPGASAGARIVVPLLALAVLALGVLAWRRRAGSLRLGTGTQALWLYVGLLTVTYVMSFASWWFFDRYLAVMLVASVPWLASGGEALLAQAGRPAWGVPAVGAAVLALNLPVAIVALSAPTAHRAPAWAGTASNLAAHANDNFTDQTAWVLRHVAPTCRVGARESGTLGFFRDRVTNLDGKVNIDALHAIQARRLPAYVASRGVLVVVDRPAAVVWSLGPRRRGFQRAARSGGFEAWVRAGHRDCVR